MKLHLCFMLAMVFVALVSAPKSTSACSCYPVSPQEMFEQSGAVFTGQVTHIQRLEGTDIGLQLVMFEWHACWKGTLSGPVLLTTAEDGAACGYEFQVGRKYLVYAFGSGPVYSTHLCSRTTPHGPGVIEAEGLGEPKFVSVKAVPWTNIKKLYR